MKTSVLGSHTIVAAWRCQPELAGRLRIIRQWLSLNFLPASFTLIRNVPTARFAIPFVRFLNAFTKFADATDVREFVLDNGPKILLLEDHKSPAVTFQVWYRVGARNVAPRAW